jgi:hypothetical protein
LVDYFASLGDPAGKSETIITGKYLHYGRKNHHPSKLTGDGISGMITELVKEVT